MASDCQDVDDDSHERILLPSKHVPSSDEEKDAEDIHSQYCRLLNQSTDSFKYDPTQSFEERLSIRTTYSKLLKSIKEEKRKIASQPIGTSLKFSSSHISTSIDAEEMPREEEANIPTSLKELIEKANYIHTSSVRNIHDATFDSHLLRLSAEAGLASLEKLDLCANSQEAPFSIGILTEKLDSFFLPSDTPFTFGVNCFFSSGAATFIDFANGPINVPSTLPSPMTLNASKRTRSQKMPTNLTHPDTLDDLIAARNELNVDQDVSALRIQQLYSWMVSRSVPILFWKLVVHPTSFSRSVENLFHLSFLIREGKARIFPSVTNDELFIEIVNTNNDDTVGSVKVLNQQYCFTLGMNSWKEFISKYSIVEPLIPD